MAAILKMEGLIFFSRNNSERARRDLSSLKFWAKSIAKLSGKIDLKG